MSKLTPPLNQQDHAQGNPDAIVTLVEYGDYQCPHCGRAYPIVKQLQKAFGRQLLFAFRHFPLSNVHEYAIPAAIAAEAAGRQDRFWEMHDMIFERQDELNDKALLKFAAALKLDLPQFKDDLPDPELADKVESNFESGVRSGVNGTPSFFINGFKYNGGFDYASLKDAIEDEM